MNSRKRHASHRDVYPWCEKRNRLFQMIAEGDHVIKLDNLKLGFTKIVMDDFTYELEKGDDSDVWLSINNEEVEWIVSTEPLPKLMERLLDQLLGNKQVTVKMLSYLDDSITFSMNTDIRLRVKGIQLPAVQSDTPCMTIGPILDARYLPLDSVKILNEEYIDDILIQNARKLIVNDIGMEDVAKMKNKRIHYNDFLDYNDIPKLVVLWRDNGATIGQYFTGQIYRTKAIRDMLDEFMEDSFDPEGWDGRITEFPMSVSFKLNDEIRIKIKIAKSRINRRNFRVHVLVTKIEE